MELIDNIIRLLGQPPANHPVMDTAEDRGCVL